MAELTDAAVQVLRAIRDQIDARCVYRGSDADAAARAGISVAAAGQALHLLSRRRLIQLERIGSA